MLFKIIQQVRRNHALEHATIHMLSNRYKGFGAQGNASINGFFLNLFGEFEDSAVEDAAREALSRLKQGEGEWARHPNCGTVLLTSATLATVAGQIVFGIERMRLGKNNKHSDLAMIMNVFPTAILAAAIAMVVGRPLGMYFQHFTTEKDPGGMEIDKVQRIDPPLVGRLFRILLGRQNQAAFQSYFIKTKAG